MGQCFVRDILVHSRIVCVCIHADEWDHTYLIRTPRCMCKVMEWEPVLPLDSQ